MTQEHSHDHEGLDDGKLTAMFVEQLRTLQQNYQMVGTSEMILKHAVLALLPDEGDAVEITLDEGQALLNEDGSKVTKIRVFRGPEGLDIEQLG